MKLELHMIHNDYKPGYLAADFITSIVIIFSIILLSPPSRIYSNFKMHILLLNILARVIISLNVVLTLQLFFETRIIHINRESINGRIFGILILMSSFIIFYTDLFLYLCFGYKFLFYVLPSLVIIGIIPFTYIIRNEKKLIME